MRAREFLPERTEPFQGLDLEMEFDEDEIWVTARDASGRELGHVLFVDTGDELVPQDLEVEERFRGQGIARVMYDWVKSKGYRIRRSNSQTRAGAEFWNRNRPGENVWEQDVAENFADGRVKGRSRPGRVKRSGASCKGSVSDLRARARKYGGERGKMYQWCLNMKSGKKAAK